MSEVLQQSILRSPEPEDQKPLRVLVAEDEPLVARLLQATLSGIPNVHVNFFDRGDQTLEHLRVSKETENSYDVVICDKGLKDGDVGIEIASIVRQEGLASWFILLSGSADRVSRAFSMEQQKEMGIDELWRKPFSPIALMATVQQRLAVKQQPQS